MSWVLPAIALVGGVASSLLAYKGAVGASITHPEMTDEEYVVYLYASLLHRDPDADGFINWINGVRTLGRFQAWRGFIDSPEFRDAIQPHGSCPVCGDASVSAELGTDAKCPTCGFISTWTRR